MKKATSVHILHMQCLDEVWWCSVSAITIVTKLALTGSQAGLKLSEDVNYWHVVQSCEQFSAQVPSNMYCRSLPISYNGSSVLILSKRHFLS